VLYKNAYGLTHNLKCVTWLFFSNYETTRHATCHDRKLDGAFACRRHNLGAMKKQATGMTGRIRNDNIEFFNIGPTS
jgi:hypothetical protein